MEQPDLDKTVNIDDKFASLYKTDAEDTKDRLAKLKAIITHTEPTVAPKIIKSKKAKPEQPEATDETLTPTVVESYKPLHITENKFNFNQIKFLELFIPMRFNVTEICQEIGISRQCYYEWLENPAFAKEIENLREYIVDLAENTLIRAMQEGDKDAAKFMLKALGNRYKDKLDITSNGNTVGNTINIIMPHNKDEQHD